jgi:glycosyltransferase involved in cell wall biosynthesis
MKILTFSNYFPEHAGGIEFVVLNLVKRWRRHHQVRWIACDIKTHSHVGEPDDVSLPALNFTENYLGFPYPIPVGRSLFLIFQQARWCDVIHIHDCLYLANLLGVLAAWWHKKPLLVTQHVGLVPYAEGYKNFLQWLAYSTLGKLVLENAEQTIFISERVKRWFETKMVFRRAPLLVSNGVDSLLFYPPNLEERKAIRTQFGFSDSEIVLLFVGRFTQKKGVHFIREMATARPLYRWIMIGNGDIDPSKWGLPNIQIIQPQPQLKLRQYYVAADLFILPSIGEGFPLAVQEALACGLPAAISHETASYLPEAPLIQLKVSSVQSMLKTLDDLFASQELICDFSEAAKMFAQRWSWEDVAKKYEIMFAELISSNSFC